MILSIWAYLLIQSSSAECLSKDDIKTNVCWALCRADGFDTGFFETKSDSCVCGQRKKYKEITDKVIRVLPKKPAVDYPEY